MKFGINSGTSQFGEQAANFGEAVTRIIGNLATEGIQANTELGKATLRTESRKSDSGAVLLSAASQNASLKAKSIVDTLNFQVNPTNAVDENGQPIVKTSGMTFRTESAKMRAQQAAEYGYALAVGYADTQGRELAAPVLGTGSVLMNGGSIGSKVSLRTEAFNSIDLRKSVAYSMGFNAAVTRQTDVVMAWFPPIFINPDQVSLEISLNLLTVFNGAYHEITGAKTEFARRNVVRAFADPTVLNRYETLIVPVVRAENVDKFVDAAVIAPAEKSYGNRKVRTAPLKFDEEISLIGISSTDALLRTGAPGHRDVIEPGTKLESIYVKSGADIIRFPTAGLKTSVFIGAQAGDQMEILLNMRTNVAVGQNLKTYLGADLVGPLAALKTEDLRLKLALNVTGTVNVETTNGKVNTPTLKLIELYNPVTNEAVTSGATFTAISDAVKTFQFLGYDLEAFRTNANRRQVGDRINTRRFNYHFVVPYRDPITAERPAHKQEEQDAQDLTNLQALIRIRIENEVIDKIIVTADTMATYVDMRDHDAEATDLIGLAQFFLVPTYVEDQINLAEYVDSQKSSERAKDIQAAIVVKLRDIVARMYTDSQFKAGTDVQSGGTLPPPQVNVLTDPIIARYIMEPGELRTLGDFDMVLTTTLNYKVRGQIFLSFRMPGQESANEPNIFNFGHLVMSPELVLAANMTREGSYFAETQVQPRYELIVLNPVMARIKLDGVKEVLRKVPGYTNLTKPLEITGVVQMENVNP